MAEEKKQANISELGMAGKSDDLDQKPEQEEENCAGSSKATEDEEAVTMIDVLEDEQNLEEDAKAVLGSADDKNCTYHSGGYMKRQALYACLTCTGPKESPDYCGGAGICLACSYHCHENHELVELYTKRNFRCDCGNKRLGNECKLASDKVESNAKNQYNQNFAGLYCTCSRPYPDAEDPIPDEMIQCVICEDWFHGRHLLKGTTEKLPNDSNYSEMLCFGCCGKYADVLSHYKGLSVTKGVVSQDESKPVNVCDKEDENEEEEEKCVKKRRNHVKEEISGTLFLPNNWRHQLCKCVECLEIFRKEGLSFLLDPEDTVHHYEAQAKNEESSQYEKGMEALSSMDRVKQVEAIQGYNSMKSNLMEYLKKFADNGKVVREEDIQEFFQQMKANKRPRVEIPKFCK